MADAVKYATNQRPCIERCFTDGRFELDMERVERQIGDDMAANDLSKTEGLADELGIDRQELASMVALHGSLAMIATFMETVSMLRALVTKHTKKVGANPVSRG